MIYTFLHAVSVGAVSGARITGHSPPPDIYPLVTIMGLEL